LGLTGGRSILTGGSTGARRAARLFVSLICQSCEQLDWFEHNRSPMQIAALLPLFRRHQQQYQIEQRQTFAVAIAVIGSYFVDTNSNIKSKNGKPLQLLLLLFGSITKWPNARIFR
jgi:hypothetical protein